MPTQNGGTVLRHTTESQKALASSDVPVGVFSLSEAGVVSDVYVFLFSLRALPNEPKSQAGG